MKYIFFVFAFAILLTSCKKTVTNENGPITGYVEFKLDGNKYRINDYLNVSAASISENTNLPLYQLVLYFTTYPSDGFGLNIHQMTNQPITAKNYVYSEFNSQERPHLGYVLPSGNIYMTDVVNSIGYINLTTFNKVIGSTISGSFSFNNIDYRDSDMNIISSGHTITDGIFEITLDNITE